MRQLGCGGLFLAQDVLFVALTSARVILLRFVVNFVWH